MNKEIWKPIKGYEGLYEISSEGEVFSTRMRYTMKLHEKNGYLAVGLTVNGRRKAFYVHKLVAEAFLPNPFNLMEVNHKDCNKHNNVVENLEWSDRKRNLQHSYDYGLKRRGELHGMHKLTEQEVLNIRKEYVKGDREHSLHALGKKYNVSWCTIQAIVTGKLWSHVRG